MKDIKIFLIYYTMQDQSARDTAILYSLTCVRVCVCIDSHPKTLTQPIFFIIHTT